MNTYGAVESPKDYRNYKIKKRNIAKSYVFPKSFELKHTEIKNQGSVGSCVAHAVSEVLESYDSICYSTAWIYGYRPFTYFQGVGMITSQALKTVRNVGYLTDNECPGNVEMNAAKKQIDLKLNEYKQSAKHRTIAAYASLKNINEIKQALMQTNTPVLLVLSIDDNGLRLNKSYIANKPTSTNEGNLHAVMCYGWNENGLLIQNSWGKNWGKNGTFIIPFDYPIKESWLITFDKNDVKKPAFYFIRRLLQKITTLLKG
jgi:C1A family cysteine protease